MARIVLDQKQYKRLNTQKQEVSRTIPKSFSDDVEVFDYEPMKKYFVYVPKVYGDDGEFGKVRAFLHSVKNGAITQMVRCINGLEDETLGLDGECPLCEGQSESWDYYNMKLEAKSRVTNMDIISSSSDEAKKIRSDIAKEREIKEPNPYTAFPIVLIGAEFEGNKLTLLRDENKKFIFTPMVYSTSEYNFTNTIQSQLDNQEISDMAGHFMVFSYVYDTKGKEPKKMDAGRCMSVTIRSCPEVLSDYVEEMDNLASFLTQYKIESSLTSFAIYPKDDLEEKRRRAMNAYKQSKLLTLMGSGGGATTSVKKTTVTPEQVLQEFEDVVDDGLDIE